MSMRKLFFSLLRWCLRPRTRPSPPGRNLQLDPLDFFTGEARGEGTIKVLMKPATKMRSESRGTPDGKGGMVLDQKVFETGKPVRISRWVLRPTSKTTSGTATNSAGPISRQLTGNRLHLKYPDEGWARRRAIDVPPARSPDFAQPHDRAQMGHGRCKDRRNHPQASLHRGLRLRAPARYPSLRVSGEDSVRTAQALGHGQGRHRIVGGDGVRMV